jgi:hypothetical protein
MLEALLPDAQERAPGSAQLGQGIPDALMQVENVLEGGKPAATPRR